ncbi:hypothetical protein BJV74DRAFT_881637 [Russula compacta]|nr:hypothetical protein BJV74DRAFT_881637 [Russula compacta]
MASTDSSSARLSRSTSDLSNAKHQGTSGASSSRRGGGKDTLPQAKIRALEQFVNFGRKGNQKAVEFPPSSWLESTSTTSPPPVVADSTPNNAAARGRAVPHRDISPPPRRPSRGASTTRSELHRPVPEIALRTSRSVSAETGVDLSHATGITATPLGVTSSPTLERRGSSYPGPGESHSEDAASPESLTLARRIQALLGSQTAQQASTPSATDATTSSGAVPSETAGPTTPGGSIPPGPVPITDSRFLALLGNANVMSGSLDKGRQSVFAILDRLRRPSAHATEAPADAAPSSTSDEEQDDSIMLYGPLVPSEDSEVELAASDIMSVFDDGETVEYEQPARPLSFAAAGGQLTPRSPSPSRPGEPTQQEGPADARQSDTQKDPGSVGWFDTWKGKVIEGGKLVSDKVAEGTKSLKEKMADGRKVVKTKTRWVPSPDKISVQATWWGYRLYLPPPVLDVLNNKRLKAAKRAAIITTALQWLLSHVPLTLVPPQFRAGVLITRRLVPYLGYIGGFVAWGWGAMKSFDKGQGITLTATWLLPVALIPGTWEVDGAVGPASSRAAAEVRSPPDVETSGSSSNSAPVG